MNECQGKPKSFGLVFGKSLLYASLQFAVGSVIMSSKFAVKNVATDQDTLNHAGESLSDYILVAVIWSLGASLVMYTNYGVRGLITSVLTNSIIISWIVSSYMSSFKYVCKKYNLQMPKLFRRKID